jgi:hypothetical protein
MTAAPVLAAGAELESLLRIGLNYGGTGLRWGLSQAEVQSLFGDDARPGDRGRQQWAREVDLSYGECRFEARLYGNKKEGALREIRVLGSSGPAAECHAQVSRLLTRLYAQQPLTTHSRSSGPVTSSSWETRTTCAGLLWSDAAPGSNVSITLRSAGCGWDGRNITANAPDPATIPAKDTNSPWESLLRLGMNDTDPAVRWDTPLAELQRRFAAGLKSDAPSFAQVRLKLAVSDADCRYDATLFGPHDGFFADREFASVHLEQTAGPAGGCRERLMSQISRLYGPRSADLEKSGWYLRRRSGKALRGDIFRASWDARAACVELTWYEGDGYTGARNRLSISASQGCGGELDGGLQPENMIER